AYSESGFLTPRQSPLSVGLFAGKWCSYAESTDLPNDQREEDGGSMVFDTEPLQEDMEILGAPTLELEITADKPIAQVAARISDVAPNGRATRVTYGLLNLTHRESFENPEPLEPGRTYKVSFNLNYIAEKFPAGNQIRLSISSSYWPLAWPPPEPARLTINLAGSKLTLPVRNNKPSDNHLRKLDKIKRTREIPTTLLVPAKREWIVQHNLANNHVSLHVTNNDPLYRLDDINWIIQKDVTEQYSYQNNNYDTLRGEVTSVRSFSREDLTLLTNTHTILTSTRTHFRIRATLDAYEGDTRIFSKTWDEKIPRSL
ncbi:MAG: CocE/NonD family hydrolase C-terminal non-catalytic domain-containing protein, partial [Bacteroidota bacterium]